MMRRADEMGTRWRSVAGLALMLAAGCSDEGAGTVSSTPKSAPEAVPTATAAKGAMPRVPRGPDQVKALQEAKAK